MSKANGEWFQEKLDKNSLDYLKLHGSKSLAEEKQILRDLKIQQKDVASFKSPSQLLINSSFAYTIHKLTHKREDKMFWWTVENLEQIRSRYNLSAEEKLFIEIEQLRIQHLERIKVTYVKGNIPKYKSLKKSIEDRIKGLCDDSLRDRRECLEYWIGVRQNVKEFEALDREINYLVGKLRMRHNKRDEAYQRIFKLQHEEVIGHCLDNCKRWHRHEESKQPVENHLKRKGNVGVKQTYVAITDGNSQRTNPIENNEDANAVINVDEPQVNHVVEVRASLSASVKDFIVDGRWSLPPTILQLLPTLGNILNEKKLAEERDGAVLDEMSSSEVGKFILEWNNNKAFRDYENFLLQSFERRQQCRDERRRTIKSCS
ncbi:hypothetical protein QL285_083669 [Trifolium repens]|nr:hypothetical protein QL285_083669 [Trifolium repens]